ncbi:MAG: hypothetical protein FalmKO_35100 [Falsiruegeria mediterranea]
MLADRFGGKGRARGRGPRPIIATWGMPVHEALEHEWAHGQGAIEEEGTAGAERFNSGAGRHGDFQNI